MRERRGERNEAPSRLKVILLSRYGRLGASSRLRYLQYLPHLKNLGIDVTPCPFFDNDYLKRLYDGEPLFFRKLFFYYWRRLRCYRAVAGADLIWVEKEVLPWLPASADRRLLRDQPYVLDLDDAWYHRYDMHPRSLVRLLLGSKIKDLARGAHTVVCGSRYLAEWACSAGAPRVELLPTVVDADRYSSGPKGRRRGPFTVGWIGSPSTSGYLSQIAGALRAVLSRSDDRLIAVGAKVSLPGIDVDNRPWSEATETELLRQIDVGIAPLSDGPWERGKCGYKLVQYMAAARPVVAAAVGANVDLIDDGVDGFLAWNEQDWVNALTRLRDDHALTTSMGAAGRAKVEQSLSVQATVQNLAAILRGAAADNSD